MLHRLCVGLNNTCTGLKLRTWPTAGIILTTTESTPADASPFFYTIVSSSLQCCLNKNMRSDAVWKKVAEKTPVEQMRWIHSTMITGELPQLPKQKL